MMKFTYMGKKSRSFFDIYLTDINELCHYRKRISDSVDDMVAYTELTDNVLQQILMSPSTTENMMKVIKCHLFHNQVISCNIG